MAVELAGATTLVTGAGSGIGRATALAFAGRSATGSPRWPCRMPSSVPAAAPERRQLLEWVDRRTWLSW